METAWEPDVRKDDLTNQDRSNQWWSRPIQPMGIKTKSTNGDQDRSNQWGSRLNQPMVIKTDPTNGDQDLIKLIKSWSPLVD